MSMRILRPLPFVAGVVLIAGCGTSAPQHSSDGTSHPAVTSTRVTTLPPPPIQIDQSPASVESTSMSGSPDRLVVTHGVEPSGTSSHRADLAVASFDFRSGSWQRLPNAPWVPIALPDGLAGVGLECGSDEDSNAPCQVEVATLRWDDKEWHHQQATEHPVTIHEGGFIEPLGARGPWAYFQVSRERDRRIIRVNAEGEIRTLPARPVGDLNVNEVKPVLCVAPDGLDTVHVTYDGRLHSGWCQLLRVPQSGAGPAPRR